MRDVKRCDESTGTVKKHRYSTEFKATAVRMAMTRGIETQSVAGALATLTSCPRPPAALYTFGCPRVVESRLAKTLEQRSIPVFRIVNSTDIVPRVPSIIWGFRHFGKLTYLTKKGDCVMGRKAQFLFVIGSIITWIGVIFIILPFSWVAGGLRPKTFSNHKISEYVRKLA